MKVIEEIMREADMEILRRAPHAQRKYSKITDTIRDRFLNKIYSDNKSIKKAAEELNINYSSAKTILTMHRRKSKYEPLLSEADISLALKNVDADSDFAATAASLVRMLPPKHLVRQSFLQSTTNNLSDPAHNNPNNNNNINNNNSNNSHFNQKDSHSETSSAEEYNFHRPNKIPTKGSNHPSSNTLRAACSQQPTEALPVQPQQQSHQQIMPSQMISSPQMNNSMPILNTPLGSQNNLNCINSLHSVSDFNQHLQHHNLVNLSTSPSFLPSTVMPTQPAQSTTTTLQTRIPSFDDVSLLNTLNALNNPLNNQMLLQLQQQLHAQQQQQQQQQQLQNTLNQLIIIQNALLAQNVSGAQPTPTPTTIQQNTTPISSLLMQQQHQQQQQSLLGLTNQTQSLFGSATTSQQLQQQQQQQWI